MSKKHFEKMCATKTSAELDSLWDHAKYVCPTDSGLMMYFNIAVLDTKGHIYYPTVVFHKDSSPTINWGLVHLLSWLSCVFVFLLPLAFQWFCFCSRVLPRFCTDALAIPFHV